MTPRDLIAAFEAVSEAPDGATRLRELVLQLAIRGRLVPQDTEDEPASVLFRRVTTEKTGLEEAGRIKKQKPVSAIVEAEILFPIPSTWEWVRAADISYPISAGSTPKKTFFQPEQAGGVPYLKVYNIRNQHIDFDHKRQFIDETHHVTKMKRSILVPGMVVLNIVGPPLGKTAIVPDTFPEWNCNQAIAFFRCIGGVLPTYLHLYLMAGVFLRNIPLVGTAGQDNLSVTKCKHIVVPLPPLAEQHRIVAKVDELMGLIDRLEAARDSREATRVALRDAALAALREADSSDEVEVAWQRIAERMDDLFTDPADVEPLRQTVLQLAVRGRLVPQDGRDEPAGDVLERIAADLSTLAKEGVGRKSKPLPPIDTDEGRSAAPLGWCLVRAGEVCNYIVPNRDKPKSFTGKIPWITIPDMSHSRRVSESVSGLGLSENEVARYKAKVVPANSVLMTCVGRFGIAAVTERDVVINQQLHAFLPTGHMLAEYLSIAIRSQKGRLEEAASATTIAYMNKTKCNSIVVPMPPLGEQHRIVAKVDELMGLLDRLEARLIAVNALHRAFAGAAVHGVEA